MERKDLVYHLANLTNQVIHYLEFSIHAKSAEQAVITFNQ